MSLLFAISFMVYLLALAFSDSTLSYKLLILFRDLLILAVISQVFNYVRKNSMLAFVVAIGIYGLIQFAGFNMLYDTFPQQHASTSSINDEYELLIETKDGSIPKSYQELIDKYHLTITKAFEPADPSLSRLDEFFMIGIPDDAENELKDIITELRRAEGTAYVELNEVITLEVREDNAVTPAVSAKHVNDPLVSQQWGWDAIQGDKVHELLKSTGARPRKKAIVAIIDSGVESLHPDLQGQFLKSNAQNDSDPLGHGTHCAGIAGAVSNNGVGVASLLPDASYVQITSIRVMNAMGVGSQQATIQGMIKAADMGVDVISMSLGGISSDSRQKAYEEAVRYANAKGIIVVAAAGNSNNNARNYAPANAKGIISVSALGTDHRKAAFSNTVQDLDYGVAAPGVKIMSTYTSQQFKELDGTSMATPMVAGLIGLLKSFNPGLSTKEVYSILFQTGKDVEDKKATGRMIQAADALERVLD
jgi:thermitase